MKNIIYYIFLLCIITGCSHAQKQNKTGLNSKNITLTDTQGNEVYLNSAAQRVICLFNPSVDVIYMLQAQDKLIGVPAETYFDNELYDYYQLIDTRIRDKKLATPGSNDMANIESIVALKPDLVIAQQLPPSTINMLNSMGIAVYLSTSDTYDNLVKEMQDISLMLGKKERGNELVAFAHEKTQQLQDNANKQSTDSNRKTVYFTWANGRIFSTAGRKSMMNNCLVLAGADNVCPSDIDKPNINPETLISWNPDMIVMWNDSPDLFYNKKELATIKAIKNKQIYNLMPMFFYNPHTFKSLCAAVAINNWAYTENGDSGLDEIKSILVKLYGNENGKQFIKFL